DGVTAPDVDDNIVQWVPWDNAGFAYADVLMDPINGHTEHGQAYITSVFAFLGRADARTLLRSMEDLDDKKDPKKTSAYYRHSLPFLNAAPGCDIDPQLFAQQMASGVEDALSIDELTDAASLRMSQDYVREVVAHEVGHVLGLRHNFAGSLEGTINRADLDDWFRAYILGKPLDAYTNKIPSSSVMDYNVFKAGVFIGWRMRTVKEALPYDIAAIRWGYFDSPEVREKKMLFGTDQDAGKYGDVRRFDYGTDPVVNAYAENAHYMEMLPNTIIETFIRARAPRNPHDRIPLEQVNLSYTAFANQIADHLAELLSWFRAETRSLSVEKQFDFIGDLNRKERYQAHWKALTNQIEQLGGIDRAVFSFMPLDLKLELKDKPVGVPVAERLSASNLTARLEKLLASTNYSTFVGLDDKKYSFTKDEQELIIKRSKKCFRELEKEVIRQVCLRFTNAPRNLDVEANGSVSDNDIVANLEKRMVDFAKQVVLAKDDSKRIKGTMDKAFVEVPEFKYDFATRLAAAHMLSANNGSFKGWADSARGDLNEDLKKEVDAALNLEHFKDFKPSMLSRPLLEWYQQQQEIISQLPAPQPPH
ncbi:MAG TPA: zinc-dependent metalloprotease, partial [Verrucomicrobiae bacterium]|nr:zinc-dependent metalloprotease [Verrucomicrobiae bacterium]